MANTVWAVCEGNDEPGHGLAHRFRYDVLVEIQIEDDADAHNAKVFCDPIIGHLQACQNSHGNTYLIHDITPILESVVEYSRLDSPFTWFRCFAHDEQHRCRRVQMRVRGLSQAGCAEVRALLACQAEQDRGKELSNNGYKVAVGGSHCAGKRKSRPSVVNLTANILVLQ